VTTFTRKGFAPPPTEGGVIATLSEELGLRDRRRSEQDEDRKRETTQIRSIAEYAELIPESRFGTIDFVQFPFQIEPFYSDEIASATEVVYMKSTQVGASTGLWRWAIHRADQFGERVIYFFPTDTHVTDFGDQRIEPSIEASEYLRSRMKDGGIRRKTLKQIGAGDISLRGLQSKTGVQSIDADALVIDEYDEADPSNIAQAERRLSGAKAAGRFPRLRRAGRPSVPGYGIGAEFTQSDQRHWLVTCPECADEQPVEWGNVRWESESGGEGNVLRPGHDSFATPKDVTRAWRACRSCETSLEPPEGEAVGPIHAGRWVAAAAGKSRVPGFHIPRLIVPRTDLEQIVVGSRATKLGEVEAFHNADLGLPWASEDAQMTEDVLDMAASAEEALADNATGYDGRYLRTAGIDVASERDLNMRVSDHLPDGRRRAVWIGEPKTFTEVDRLIRKLGVALFCVDSMPERRLAKTLCADHAGRGFMVRYDDQPESDTIRYDEEKNLITVNRTEALDAMFDSFRERENIPMAIPPPRWKEQMMSPTRRLIEDSKGRPRKVYVSTSSVGDDYAHAEVYDLVAQQMAMLLEMFTQGMRDQAPVEMNPPTRGRHGWDSDSYDPGFGEQ